MRNNIKDNTDFLLNEVRIGRLKSLGLLTCFLSIIGLTSFVYVLRQSNSKLLIESENKKNEIKRKIITINKLEEEIVSNTLVIDTLSNNQILLTDRILEYNLQIDSLEQRINILKELNEMQREEIIKNNDEIENLNTKLAQNNISIASYSAKLKNLIDSKNSLTESIISRNDELNKIELENLYYEKTLSEYKEKILLDSINLLQNPLYSLSKEIQINITEFILTKANGKKLKKVKDNNWYYTRVKLQISNFKDVDNEKKFSFKMRILDLESKRNIAYIEESFESRKERNSVDFNYSGNPISLVFFNSEKKTSLNYALQFYITDEVSEVLLNSGQVPIIIGGKVKKPLNNNNNKN